MKRIPTTAVLALIIPAVIFGGIGIARSLGWWITAGGSSLAASRLSETGAVLADPAEIRGSTSFAEIEAAFGLSSSMVAEAFGIEAGNPGIVRANYIDSIYGEVSGTDGESKDIGTDSVKLFVSRMTGIPYEPEAATGLPASAIDAILFFGPGMTEQERQELFAREADSRTAVFDPSDDSHEDEESEGTAVSGSLEWRGRTTFGELIALGVGRAEIEEAVGFPIESTSQAVRDFADAHGLSFSEIKTTLGALLGD